MARSHSIASGVAAAIRQRDSMFYVDVHAAEAWRARFLKKPLRPEERLMFAVFRDALSCFYEYAFSRDEKGRRLFEEAQEWIGSDDREWPLSFENICDHFSLTPQCLRIELERWYKQKERARQHSGEKALEKTGKQEGGHDVVV